MENINTITVWLEKGQNGGLIGRDTSDGGPWVVPGNQEQHAVQPKVGRQYRVVITGQTKKGNLRFCRVVADVAIERKAAEAAALVEDEEILNLLREALDRCMTLEDFQVFWKYAAVIDHGVNLSTGEVEVHSIHLYGREWQRETQTPGHRGVVLVLQTPLATTNAEKRRKALAHALARGEVPEWALPLSRKIAAWREVHKEHLFALGIQRELEYLLIDAQIANLRMAVDKLPGLLEEKGAILKPNFVCPDEELAKIAGRPGSETGPLGAWESVKLPERPVAGKMLRKNGEWYIAISGWRREGTRDTIGGLYARWVKVPEEVSRYW